MRLFHQVRTAAQQLARGAIATAQDYVVIVRGGSEGKGLATLNRLARGGPLVWFGLALLLVSIVATAYLGLYGGRFPTLSAQPWEGDRVSAPAPALAMSLLVAAFAWGYLMLGAATHSLGFFVFIASYVASFGLYIALNLANTLWFSLFPWWMLILGGWTASLHAGRWRLPLLALLCYLVSMLTYSSLGLNRLAPRPWGLILLTGLYLLLVANRWALKARPLKPTLIVGVTAALLMLLYVLTYRRASPEQVLGDTYVSIYNLLGLVSLYWYWIGLDVLSSAHDLVLWTSRSVRRAVSPHWLGPFQLALLTAWGAIAYLIVFGMPSWLIRLAPRALWGIVSLTLVASASLPIPFIEAARYHLYLTGGALIVLIGLWVSKRATAERLIALFNVWLFSLIVLSGYFYLLYAFAADDIGQALGPWPYTVFVLGMVWEVLKTSPELITRVKERTPPFLGFILLLTSISLLQLAAQNPDFYRIILLNSFNGFLYLGIPYLLYTYIYARYQYTIISSRTLALLFIAGMLSAIPCLAMNSVFWVPILWSAVMVVVERVREHWDDPFDGITCGVTMAIGFTVFYTNPVLIPLPTFVRLFWLFHRVQTQYVLRAQGIYRAIGPSQTRWWLTLAQLLVAGILVGSVLYYAQHKRRAGKIALVALSIVLGVLPLAAAEWLVGTLP